MYSIGYPFRLDKVVLGTLRRCNVAAGLAELTPGTLKGLLCVGVKTEAHGSASTYLAWTHCHQNSRTYPHRPERKTRSMKLFTGLALSLLLCTAVVSVVKADDDDLGSRAFVLVQKSVNTPEEIKHSEGTLKNVLVQSRNATVTITVNNVGGLVASDVQVEDSFEEELFEISGVTSAKYDKLLPGEQREFSYQIVPTWHTEDLRNVSQYYTQKAATVLYSYGEDEDLNERVSESSTEQIVPVFSNEDYLARTAMFAREWITFFLLSAGPVLGPLFYYTYVSNLIKEGQKRR